MNREKLKLLLDKVGSRLPPAFVTNDDLYDVIGAILSDPATPMQPPVKESLTTAEGKQPTLPSEVVERVRMALGECLIHMEVLTAQIKAKPYIELTADFQAEIVATTERARRVLLSAFTTPAVSPGVELIWEGVSTLYKLEGHQGSYFPNIYFLPPDFVFGSDVHVTITPMKEGEAK